MAGTFTVPTQRVLASSRSRQSRHQAASAFASHPRNAAGAHRESLGLPVVRRVAGIRRGRTELRPCAVSPTATVAGGPPAEKETYECNLDKPLLIKFQRGNYGGCFVKDFPPQAPGDYCKLEVGDKVVGISASFGSEVWKAENYGQVMYAMKTRAGEVYLKLEKNNGDLTLMEPPENDNFQRDRNAGNYGEGTKVKQAQNYSAKKKLEAERIDMFNVAIGKFGQAKYQEAVLDFENIIGLEPKNYMGDNFETTTDVYRVSQYNCACCYSKMDNVEAAMEAMNIAMRVGFDDYDKIRTDPNLEFMRAADREKFKKLMDKYDEPFINENALKAFRNLFGGGKDDDLD